MGPRRLTSAAGWKSRSTADGPASVSAAMAVASGNGRAVLTQVLPIQDLPAGRYVLRAVLAAPNAPAHTISRSFEKP